MCLNIPAIYIQGYLRSIVLVAEDWKQTEFSLIGDLKIIMAHPLKETLGSHYE